MPREPEAMVSFECTLILEGVTGIEDEATLKEALKLSNFQVGG
jgi:hypothetical protein